MKFVVKSKINITLDSDFLQKKCVLLFFHSQDTVSYYFSMFRTLCPIGVWKNVNHHLYILTNQNID